MSFFNTAITLGLVLGFSLLMLGFACSLVLIVQLQKLLRQIRELAQLYPPYYGVSEEEGGRDQSNVQIDPLWNEELDGRD